MDNSFHLKCLDSKYDEESGMLILFCLFEDLEVTRIVHFHKSDFCYKHPGQEPPDNEMHRTADMWRGKRFKMIMNLDPQAKDVSKDEWNEMLEGSFESIRKALSDPNRAMARKIADLQMRKR